MVDVIRLNRHTCWIVAELGDYDEGEHTPFFISEFLFNKPCIVAELGDYDEGEHTPGFISEFRFVPESKQTEDLELAILEAYKLRR